MAPFIAADISCYSVGGRNLAFEMEFDMHTNMFPMLAPLHSPRWMQIQGTVGTKVRKGHRSLISTLCHWPNHRTKNMNHDKMKIMPVSFPLASDFVPAILCNFIVPGL